MKNQWTKGKWEADEISIGLFHICSIKGGHICRVEAGSMDETDKNEANAHRICQCVNNFDELLSICKEAKRLYDHLALSPLAAASKYGPDYEPPTDEEWLEMRKGLEKAIAKATKGSD